MYLNEILRTFFVETDEISSSICRWSQCKCRFRDAFFFVLSHFSSKLFGRKDKGDEMRFARNREYCVMCPLYYFDRLFQPYSRRKKKTRTFVKFADVLPNFSIVTPYTGCSGVDLMKIFQEQTQRHVQHPCVAVCLPREPQRRENTFYF